MGIRAHAARLGVRVALWGVPVWFPGIAALGAGLGLAGATLLVERTAEGKSSRESPYGFDRTWNAALRLVRVDLGLKVLEKDDANGYLLFEYRSSESGPKATSGSFEVIKTGAHLDEVKVVVQLPQMPRYHEQVLLDRLAQKMRDEYGDPPPPRPPAPIVADAGADASSEEY